MSTLANKILYMVIPCYNEQEVLPVVYESLVNKMNSLVSKFNLSKDSKILFVDDGSTDETWDFIKNLSSKFVNVKGISLSRNMGHQNALLAGLSEAKGSCDICVSIDCDGQDDINAIDEMIIKYSEGNDIVYGVRADRSSDSFLKKFTAESFYKILQWLGCDTIYNHADYRLVSKKALDALFMYQEVNLYLRGIFPLIGYKYSVVEYKRNARIKGESHYPLSKMIGLALNGITNLSVKPLHIVMGIGFFIAVISFLGVIWSIYRKLTGNSISGWASTTCIICFVSGIQLTCMGVIGEYVGKIYFEAKRRPKFIISEKTC